MKKHQSMLLKAGFAAMFGVMCVSASAKHIYIDYDASGRGNDQNMMAVPQQESPYGDLRANIMHAPEGQNGTAIEYPLVDENFSLMTKGEFGKPYKVPLADSGDEIGFFIDPQYTAKPGWWGEQLYQAGGMIYMNPTVSSQSVLSTYFGDFSGDLTITFRMYPDERYNVDCYMNINCLTSVGTRPYGKGENTNADFHLYNADKGEWTDVTIKMRNYSADETGFMQLFLIGTPAYIDDFKVTTTPNFIAAPVIKEEEYRANSVVLNWQPVRRATSYRIRIYEKEYVEGPYANGYTLDFNDGQLPENCGYKGYQGRGPQFSQTGVDNSTAIELRSTDMLILPKTNAVYKTIRFYLRGHFSDDYASKNDVMSDNSMITICWQAEDGYWDWRNAQVIREYLDEKGRYFEVPEETMLLRKTQFAIRFISIHDDDAYIVIDNVEVETEPEFVWKPVKCYPKFDNEDPEFRNSTSDYLSVKDTSYELVFNTPNAHFKYLDPDWDYGYSVCARYLKLDSEEEIHEIEGLLTPVAEPISVNDAGRYVARWNNVARCDYYHVNRFVIEQYETDQKDAIIYADYFSKVNEDLTAGMTPPQFIDLDNWEKVIPYDDYTDTPGWECIAPIASEGCFGSYYGGWCNTPIINFSNGSNTRIRGKFWAQGNSTISVYGSISRRRYLKLILPYTDTDELVSWEFELPLDQLDNVADFDRLRFVTQNFGYFPILLDYLEIVQDVKAGAKHYTYLGWQEIDAGTTTCELAFPEDQEYGSVGYSVVAYRDLNSWRSNHSELMEYGVPTGITLQTGIEAVSVDQAEAEVYEVARYSIDGRLLSKPEQGINIVVMSDGSAQKVIIR